MHYNVIIYVIKYMIKHTTFYEKDEIGSKI